MVVAGLVFEWDRFNTEHIARHGVTPAEAEEVLRQEPVVFGQSDEGHERRWVKVGESFAGRVLVVIHTLRGNRIRVVTSYPANRSQRATYRRLRS